MRADPGSGAVRDIEGSGAVVRGKIGEDGPSPWLWPECLAFVVPSLSADISGAGVQQ